MKNALKEKFKNNVLVKPLYKRLKNVNKIKPIMVISVDKVKLDGHGVKVKSDSISHGSDVFTLKNTRRDKKKLFVCESCGCLNNNYIFKELRKGNVLSYGMEGSKTLTTGVSREMNDNLNKQDERNKRIQTVDIKDVPFIVPCTWLRVYPLPQSPGESVGSVILRCVFCQFGLVTFLVMWTAMWVFVIHYFEAPAEIKMYQDFEYQQNKHVIDLATELRMISPLSFRWREAIKKRISEASETSVTLLKDDRLVPGEYWSLSGTFLFTIYVMTALGFGAPVPQTFEGRGAVLVYAALAIPVHFYLMMNTSMCIIVHAQTYMHQCSIRIQDRKQFVLGKTALDNESPNCSRNSEVLKSPSSCCVVRKIMRCLSILGACHSLPLASLLYYLAGVCIFGMLRYQGPVKTLIFPLEFTTSGELDHIQGYFRILYGFYVEGAMLLVACVLATLRRSSTPALARVSEKYRLYATEK